MFHENLELCPVEHFDLLNVVAEEVDIPFIKLQLLFPDVIDFECAIRMIDIHFFDIDNRRELHNLV